MQLNQALEVAIGDAYKSTGGWRVKRMGCGRGRLDRRGNLFQSGVKTDGDSSGGKRVRGRVSLAGVSGGDGRAWIDGGGTMLSGLPNLQDKIFGCEREHAKPLSSRLHHVRGMS